MRVSVRLNRNACVSRRMRESGHFWYHLFTHLHTEQTAWPTYTESKQAIYKAANYRSVRIDS